MLTQKRQLLPAQSWMDPEVDGFSQLAAVYLGEDGTVERDHPVFAFFRARRSELNHRIFASIGELSGAKVFELKLIAVIFLLIEIAALVIGVVLTRAITRTVSDLYRATQFVQEGNFSHRVRVERQDQLGVLGESFNSMTNSIRRLIDEQNTCRGWRTRYRSPGKCRTSCSREICLTSLVLRSKRSAGPHGASAGIITISSS